MAKDLNNILLSTIEENKIKEKTPDKLPLNPTAAGWSGQEVRRFLAKSLIDNEGSFLAEFKKKMAEIKAQFEDVFGDGDGNIQGQIDSIIAEFEDNIARIENITGNAETATSLKTPVDVTVGNATKQFDGSSNLSFTLEEIGTTGFDIPVGTTPPEDLEEGDFFYEIHE